MKPSYLTLNIGCGADKFGEVRLDQPKQFLNYAMQPNILGDACHLPFQDHLFDMVKFTNVIEHLHDPTKGLEEAMRVCRKHLVIAFPTERDIWPNILINLLPPNRNLFQVLKTRSEKLHLWQISFQHIVKCLRSRGFQCRVFKRTYCLIPPLESGRKARFLKWLSARLRISVDIAVVGWKK